MAEHWLNDFVEFSSFTESSEKALYWVGVWAVASVLRRKVWIDQLAFQWTPNFYLLIVGPPGTKKTTSIQMGMRFMTQVEGLDFGPQIVTWQQLISHMAGSVQTYQIDGKPFKASCVTISISEFGSFFDPMNRELIDNLTDIWDSKLGTIKKETRTMGDDEIVNPWLNIAAGTTPGWLADNFSSKLLRSGFASRPIFIYEDIPPKEKDVPYPSRVFRACSAQGMLEASLIKRLQEMAEYSGEFKMSEEAFRWGELWYAKYREVQRASGSQEASFYERKQTHLHKLAMVICAATGGFPSITVEHLREADKRLSELEPDVKQIFGYVGQTRMSQAATDLMKIMSNLKTIRKRDLYKRYFFRTMDNNEFELAVKSAAASGQIELVGPLDDLVIRVLE